MTTTAWPDEHTLIPDLLVTAPAARRVLDRFGLQGCGGPLGPHETLGFFAKGHEVPLEVLLKEIRIIVQEEKPAPAPAMVSPGLADAIYRPFFKAGIAVILTLGAVWGAWLLLKISRNVNFMAVSIHEVNAHGHAQIFGWVGLFVMGFAYQAFPRFKHTSLAHPRLAFLSLWLLLVGLVTRALLEPQVSQVFWLAYPVVAGSCLEVMAIALFVFIIGRTWKLSGKPLAFYDWYILSALIWFVLQAVYETIFVTATLWAPDEARLFRLVSVWQPPLREMQIHGFAMLMILGVSQRLLHHFFGLPAPTPRVSLLALICLNTAIVGEVVSLLLMRTAGRAWAGLWIAAALLLAGTVVGLLRNWRLFARVEEPERSLKFIRTAYVWLLISLAMLVLFPLYQYALLPWLCPESPGLVRRFSHAYYGAARHAITVGFISMMIVGVAAKVVPTLNGLDIRRLSALWGPYLLINIGCALRVGGQTMTDFTPDAFWVTPISGFLEVSGLAMWGFHLWRIMAGYIAMEPVGGTACAHELANGAAITAAHRVGVVLEHYPHLLDTFLSFGFKPLANPFLRRTLARQVTISQACRLQGVEVQQLLDALNGKREPNAAGKLSLPVLSGN